MENQNQLQVFNSDEFGNVRTLEINGKPYFVASDIAKDLGYKNTSDAIARHCKGIVKHDILTSGGKQTINIIPEGDVYRLIIKSQLPSAEKFELWVFDDVLPSIRKTGGYVAPNMSGMDTYVLDLAKSMQLTNTVVQGIMTTVTRMEDFVKDSIRSKDLQIEETADMIGLRDKNTKMLTIALKDKLRDLTGDPVSATSSIYKKIRLGVFKEMHITKWEEISIGEYNRAFAFIDSIDSVTA